MATSHYNLIRVAREDNNKPSDLLGSRKSKIPPLGKFYGKPKLTVNFTLIYLYLMMGTVGSYMRIPPLLC